MQPQIIIDYLQQQSKGKINISLQQATHIIELVRGVMDAPGPVARLSRYNAVKQGWEHLYTVKTTQDEIDSAIKYALDNVPVLEAYMWECFNAAGDAEGKIFSVHNNLF